jgi:hypothetical protein
LVGPDGDLWAGSDAGIVRIPKPDLNDSYFTDSTAYRLGSQKSDEVDVLFRARDGTIWAGPIMGCIALTVKDSVAFSVLNM